MRTSWLRILAFLGDREARKRLNRSEGSRRAWLTRKRRSMAVKVGEPQTADMVLAIKYRSLNASDRPLEYTVDPTNVYGSATDFHGGAGGSGGVGEAHEVGHDPLARYNAAGRPIVGGTMDPRD